MYLHCVTMTYICTGSKVGGDNRILTREGVEV